MSKKVIISLIIFLGLAVRLWLVPKYIVGDLVLYMDWGRAVWDFGARNLYFGDIAWEHSAPNYPPLAMVIFAGLDWLWEHKYFLAQAHNVIKIPPAFFIVYFYKYGNLLLFKLVPTLCDLGVSIIIYKVLLGLTKNTKKAMLGMALYFLNPIAIFLSGVWGQLDSIIALFGILAFTSLVKKKFPLAVILFFIGMNIKPNWGIFIPFFVYMFFALKPKVKDIVLSAVLVVVAYLVLYWPFGGNQTLAFTRDLFWGRFILPLGTVGKASYSAFNFHTIFLKIDRDFYNARILGILPAFSVGYISLIATNFVAYLITRSKKNMYVKVFSGLFVIGLGYFMFGVNMLERYFFPALIPLIILGVYNTKLLFRAGLLSLFFFANIIWSFFRRGSDEIDHLFTNYNFALIKVVSFLEVVVFVGLTKKLLNEKD